MEERKDILKQMADLLSAVKSSSIGAGLSEAAGPVDLLADYFTEVYNAKEKGEPLAWVNFAMFSELFWAMDIVPVCVEIVNGVNAANPETLKYIDLAEEHIADYVCASNKLHLGMVLSGDLPVPDILIHPSKPCDSNIAEYAIMSEYFEFPYFCIDMPYFNNERGTKYVLEELRKLVTFLEEVTNRKLDYNKLKKVMEYSNAAHEYILKLSKVREAVPAPHSSLDSLSEYPLVLTLAGTPQLVDFFKNRYEVEKAKVERKEGYLGKDGEKIRMAWIYGAPAFDLGLFFRLEQEYGAIAVANMNNNFVMKPVEDISSTDAILRGLAQKMLLMPMTRECGGPWEQYVDASIDLCRRAQADCAIFAGHVACKGNWAIIKLVKDKITEELGIPVMVIELDLFDPRVLSSEALMNQFDDFFKLVLRK